jgi:hypothetical protein
MRDIHYRQRIVCEQCYGSAGTHRRKCFFCQHCGQGAFQAPQVQNLVHARILITTPERLKL